MCDCYKIGGPWIAEDPECPIHGQRAQKNEKEQAERDTQYQEKIESLEARVLDLEEKLTFIVLLQSMISVSDNP
jgi:hypothetical protein